MSTIIESEVEGVEVESNQAQTINQGPSEALKRYYVLKNALSHVSSVQEEDSIFAEMADLWFKLTEDEQELLVSDNVDRD